MVAPEAVTARVRRQYPDGLFYRRGIQAGSSRDTTYRGTSGNIGPLLSTPNAPCCPLVRAWRANWSLLARHLRQLSDVNIDTYFAPEMYESTGGHLLPYRLYSPCLESDECVPLVLHMHGHGG